MSFLQLLLHVLEQLFALYRTLVHLLLHSALLDCLVSNIVKLCNEQIVHLISTVARHNSHDLSHLSLEFNDFFSELASRLLISNLPDKLLVLVNLLVRLLDRFVDLSTLIEVLLLQGLDSVEQLFLRELNFCFHEQFS